MNECRVCGLDFSSVENFDFHRVGVHAYTYSEGLKMESPREDGRRCLSLPEMKAAGWATNEHGRWRKRPRTMSASARSSLSKGKG